MNILDFFSKYSKFIIASALVLIATSFFDRTLITAVMLIIVLAAVAMFFILRNKEEKQKKFLSGLFLIAFSLHVLVTFFVYYANFQPFSGGYGDYVVYQQQAQEISERVQQRNFSLQGIVTGHYYPIVVGYLYAFTAPNMLLGQLFNAWLVALIVIFIYLIVREIGGSEKEGFLAGLMAAFYPSLSFYGSLLLKDALVVLSCAIGLLLTIKIIKRFSWLNFFIFFIVLTGLINLRFYIGYALMFGFMVSWFLASTFNLKKRIIYGIIILFLLGFSPKFLGHGYYGFKNLKGFLNAKTIIYYREMVYVPQVQPSAPINPATQPETAAPQTNNASSAERRTSSIVIKAGLENPIIFVKNTFLSFICSLLGPFPWQLTRLKHILVLPESIVWPFMLFFIIKGMIKYIKARNRIVIPLIIFSVLAIGALSLFMTNFGIITRIRMPAFLALLCLFPFGINWNSKKLDILTKFLK